MKKFLPKRKTERKPSDEEFVIRKSKWCIFLLFLEVSVCSVTSRALWEQPFLQCRMLTLSASAHGAEHRRLLEAQRSPASEVSPPSYDCRQCHQTSLWWQAQDHGLWVVLFWLRSHGATSKYLKAPLKLLINGHQNVAESWDKPLPGHASRFWNSFYGSTREQKVHVPAGVFTRKEQCPDSSLKCTWDVSWVFYMKGHGHPAVSCCCVQPEGRLSPSRR